MDASTIALQGLQTAEVQLESAAVALANAGANSTDSAGVDVVDLSTQMVALMSAKNSFEVNLATLKTVDQMQHALLDVKA